MPWAEWDLACRAYPDTGTVTSEDVFNLLAIRGPTHGEGMLGIEPGSPVSQSSPLPLHRWGFSAQCCCQGEYLSHQDSSSFHAV